MFNHLKKLIFIAGTWLSGLIIIVPFVRAAETPLKYQATITGVKDSQLRDLMESVADTFTMLKRPPASVRLLQRRAKNDVPRILAVLKSQGYYEAQVSPLLDREAVPVRVTFRVNLGLPYSLSSFTIALTDADTAGPLAVPGPTELGLKLNNRCRSKAILSAEETLLAWLKTSGFPYAHRSDRTVIVDHETKTVSVTLSITAGLRAQFGPTEISGLETLPKRYIQDKIPWKEGDQFNVSLMYDAQKALYATGCFATVRVSHADVPGQDGRVLVSVDVKEALHRTIKVGAGYSTDEKLGGKISWEHRNISGHGDNLTMALKASDIVYAAESSYKMPGFFHRYQSLVLYLRVGHDHPDAYTSRSIKGGALLERSLGKRMKLGGGLALKKSRDRQLGETEHYYLVSVPLHFSWDTSNDFLDPKRGGRFTAQLTPSLDPTDEDISFLKSYATYTRYVQVIPRPLTVLALRGVYGTINGSSRNNIPPDDRYYAGGGGSIRGYAYQSVGPHQEGEPVGGRSLLEISLEARTRLTEKLGVVIFLDGGRAYESQEPDFSKNLRWGAGTGFRWYTAIGPLRFDIGFPLNRRDQDDPFQMYLSIGQAF